MQGWLFVVKAQFWGAKQIAAYMGAVPDERMILLDLISEGSPAYSRTNFYGGKPFVWSLLHNFGGQIGMRGNLRTVMERPWATKQNAGKGMVGVGLTMEGTNQNAIMYEMALSRAWEEGPDANDVTPALEKWVTRWARARYGARHGSELSQHTVEAWQLMSTSVYKVQDLHDGIHHGAHRRVHFVMLRILTHLLSTLPVLYSPPTVLPSHGTPLLLLPGDGRI
jgi:alpha-N-acetylglucosaminidase